VSAFDWKRLFLTHLVLTAVAACAHIPRATLATASADLGGQY
jgi:hypothetical protein